MRKIAFIGLGAMGRQMAAISSNAASTFMVLISTPPPSITCGTQAGPARLPLPRRSRMPTRSF